MVDGSVGPISEVEVGDKAKATDPTTGGTIVHDGEGGMTCLAVAS